MKHFSRLCILPILLFTMLFPAACSPQTAQEEWDTYAIQEITVFGNIALDISGTDFLEDGYNYGDIITAEIYGNTFTMPIGSSYSDVEEGNAICCVFINESEQKDSVELAINMQDIATITGIAEKTVIEEEPGYLWTFAEDADPSVRITMKEAGGYADEYAFRNLVRSSDREDYPHLNDKEFANFRPVTTTGVGEGKLYRSASPINPEIGRNTYAVKAVEEAGIRTIINLADTAEIAATYEGFATSYYASCNVTYLNLGINVLSEDFGKGLVKGLHFLAAAEEGPFLVHCLEGKDRAGFVSALLECLMGATAEEVSADYMTTYANYYGVEKDTEQYHYIRTANIEKTLARAFDVEDIYKADLSKEAAEYMMELGLTADEVEAIRTKLS